MKEVFEKNKVPAAIIIAGIIIALSIWFSNRPATTRTQSKNETNPTTQQMPKQAETLQQPTVHINYTEASEHIGDHTFTTSKGTIFINFCSDYKTCPFGVAIFSSEAHKYSNPKQYENKTVEITGLLRSYQGRPEIIVNDPGQIKIK
jgi:DNA/RNA endonuclease YhcR with UshA esterase domain